MYAQAIYEYGQAYNLNIIYINLLVYLTQCPLQTLSVSSSSHTCRCRPRVAVAVLRSMQCLR